MPDENACFALQVNGQEPSADEKAAIDKALQADDDEPEAAAPEEEATIVDPAQVCCSIHSHSLAYASST